MPLLVSEADKPRWATALSWLNSDILFKIIVIVAICVLAFQGCRAEVSPTPDIGPSNSRPILAPANVDAPAGVETAVTVRSLGTVTWHAPAYLTVRDDGLTATVKPAAEGEYALKVSVDAGGYPWSRHPSYSTWIKVRSGKGPLPPPVPPGPVPPGPTPPTPSDLGPFGGAAGLHVLIVYESGAPLTKEQTSAIYGKEFRQYIEEKCAKGPDGKTPQRRIYDKDEVMTGESKLWQDAMKRCAGKTPLPWLAVGNGNAWFEGPLTGDFLAQVKKIGG